MRMVEVACERCGKIVVRREAEVNRSLKLGRRFFCGHSCTAQTANAPRRSKEIVAVCICGNRFTTSTNKKSAKYCSSACADKNRYRSTEKRQQAGFTHSSNLIPNFEVLRRRESWKYAALEQTLKSQNRIFQFEYPLSGYIFDLALLDTKTIVEFDGPYHCDQKQIAIDDDKNAAAIAAGFVVVRRRVEPAVVISPETITSL